MDKMLFATLATGYAAYTMGTIGERRRAEQESEADDDFKRIRKEIKKIREKRNYYRSECTRLRNEANAAAELYYGRVSPGNEEEYDEYEYEFEEDEDPLDGIRRIRHSYYEECEFYKAQGQIYRVERDRLLEKIARRRR